MEKEGDFNLMMAEKLLAADYSKRSVHICRTTQDQNLRTVIAVRISNLTSNFMTG
jgi:hypothetical protein